MKKKLAALAMAALLGLGAMTGCSTSLKNVTVADYPSLTVGTFGSESFSLGEVNFYLRALQYLYEMYYGSYYGDELWTMDYSGDQNFGDYIKTSMVNKVYQIHMLCSKADSLGVSLSDEDKEKVETAVDEWIADTDANVQAAISMSRDDLITLYTENALANLVYKQIIADTDRNVTDDEARQWSVSVVSMNDSSEEYDAAAAKEAMMASMDAGMTLSEAVDEYTDYSFSDSTYSIGSEDVDSYGFAEAAMTLATGEYTTYTNEDTGYSYLIYCLDDFSESATESQKETIIAERESDLFQTTYSAWVEEAPALTINEDVLSLLTFDEAVYVTEAETETEEETIEVSVETEDTTAAEETETVSEETTAAEADTEAEAVSEETTAAEAETEAETVSEETSAAE